MTFATGCRGRTRREETGRTVKISVIQSQKYWRPHAVDLPEYLAGVQRTVDETFDMMSAAADDGADLLVTVETVNGFDPPMRGATLEQYLTTCEPLDGPLVARFSEFARDRAVHVVAGLRTTREGKAYNSAVLIGPDGATIGVYDKVHMPVLEDVHISPGDSLAVFQTELGNIGMLICWDMEFPEAARELSLQGADLIVCPTWGWIEYVGRSRAYENSLPIATAMGVGNDGKIGEICDPSCIIDGSGTVVAVASRSGPQVVSAVLDLESEPRPPEYLVAETGIESWRRIRMSQRRPEAYRYIAADRVPLADRYPSFNPPRRKD